MVDEACNVKGRSLFFVEVAATNKRVLSFLPFGVDAALSRVNQAEAGNSWNNE